MKDLSNRNSRTKTVLDNITKKYGNILECHFVFKQFINMMCYIPERSIDKY